MLERLSTADPELSLLYATTSDIINSITLEDVQYFLETLGVKDITVNNDHQYLMCPTICHNPLHEHASKKLYWYQDNKIFRCYTECNEAMSIFDLYRKVMELNYAPVSYYDAKEYVKSCVKHLAPAPVVRHSELELDTSKYKFTNNVPELPEYPHSILTYFTSYHHPSWLKDGITEQAMDKFKIKFSLGQNKIVIPHFDINGRLIGIRGRALDENDINEYGKYRPIQIGQTLYTHPLQFNLYGIYEH